MNTHFTFLGTVTQALSEQSARIRIGSYDCFSTVEPGIEEVNVYLNNLHAPQTVIDLKNTALEVTIGSLPAGPEDLVYGVFRQINEVEKFIAEDYLGAGMEKTSRAHLEAFLNTLETCETLANGNKLFTGSVTSRFGNRSIRELLPVEVSLRNDRGQISLRDTQNLGAFGYPVIYNTRTHVMKTAADGALVILGRSAHHREFVLWLHKQELSFPDGRRNKSAK